MMSMPMMASMMENMTDVYANADLYLRWRSDCRFRRRERADSDKHRAENDYLDCYVFHCFTMI
jgi:hypothetical protein